MMLLATLDWYSLFFLLFALLTCGFAVGVLFSDNIVHMAFYLTLSLGSCAGLFFLAGAPFVGAMQLMIYVGGTVVLLAFGVMLTANANFSSLRIPRGGWVVSLIVGGLLLVLLLTAALRVESWRTPRDEAVLPLAEVQTATVLGAGLTGVRVDKLHEDDPVTRRGMSGYLLPFVIISVHLLVVLVGAAYMARTRIYRRSASGNPRSRTG